VRVVPHGNSHPVQRSVLEYKRPCNDVTSRARQVTQYEITIMKSDFSPQDRICLEGVLEPIEDIILIKLVYILIKPRGPPR
jgi:hypothetical protein